MRSFSKLTPGAVLTWATNTPGMPATPKVFKPPRPARTGAATCSRAPGGQPSGNRHQVLAA